MDCLKFKSEITDKIGGTVGKLLSEAINAENVGKVKEIRLRTEKPISVVIDNESYFLTVNGFSLKYNNQSLRMTVEDMRDLLLRICRNSIYAYAEEIRNGFVTLHGGHRVGICGKVQSDGMIRDISALNIRISKQIIGASDKILPYVVKNLTEIRSTLIISPPCCGKTTIVRDLARFLSDGGNAPVKFRGVNVGIIDERSEICSMENGIPMNDVGVRTDVLDGCAKDKGIYMMIRSMAPSIIVTDEIGGAGDYAAIASAINSGVKVIATAHGSNLEEVRARREIGNMIDDNFFERFVVLDSSDGPGTIKTIV